MPDVLIATMSSMAAAPVPAQASLLKSVVVLALCALLLTLLMSLLRFAAGWAVRRWRLQRAAQRTQTLGAVLCASSLAVVLVIGFVKPRFLPADTRSIPEQHLGWLVLAGAIALATMPLAWRAAYRLFHGRRSQGSIDIQVPAARVATLCLLSVAAIAILVWQGSRHGPLPAFFFVLYVAFVFSVLLTALPALRWLLQRVRPSAPTA